MCQSILNSGETNYLVEGDVLLPVHLQLMQENYPDLAAPPMRMSLCIFDFDMAAIPGLQGAFISALVPCMAERVGFEPTWG